MAVLNLVLGSILGLTILMGIYWAWANHSRYKKNTAVAAELYKMMHSLADVARETQEQLQKEGVRLTGQLHDRNNKEIDLHSPAILSSLITVIVKKFGDIRLSMKDFSASNEEYISVYVDMTSNDLILSVSHSLTEEQEYSMVNFTATDDNTFH
jgi:hypothetical protein